MPLGNPIDAWLQMAQSKNQNQRNSYQDIQGIGEGLGQGFNSIGQAMQRKKELQQEQQKKQQWQQTINDLMQNPNLPPQMKAMLPAMAQHPELIGQIGPELLKSQTQQRPEYTAVPGVLSKANKPFIFDKFTGKMTEGPLEAKPSGGMGSAMADIRGKQFTLQDLPSNQGPSTAAGAAYQVKVAARQGKNLIARAGSSQRLGLAQGDLARAVLRNSPTDEAMKNANFSQNTINRWNQIKQQVTSDPTAVNNPKIRKEMYDIFDEMDKSATPFIQNQLDDMASVGFPVNDSVRKRQLGQLLPDIPFQESSSTGTATSGGGWGIQKVQ